MYQFWTIRCTDSINLVLFHMLSAKEYLKSIYEASRVVHSRHFIHPFLPWLTSQANFSISTYIIAVSQLAANDTPHDFEAVRDSPSEVTAFGRCVRGKEYFVASLYGSTLAVVTRK